MAADIKDWSANDLENIMLDDINLSREQGGEVAKLMGAIKRKFDDVDLEIAGVAGAYTYKGTVDTVADLPDSGNRVGDVYNVTSGTDGGNYAWDGAEWDKTGDSLVDVDGAQVLARGSTTKRTLGDRFADVVNVKDYGAKGDGSTDDSAAFAAAAAEAKTSGKPLYGAGTFYLASSLDLREIGLRFADARLSLASESACVYIGGNSNMAGRPDQTVFRVALKSNAEPASPLVFIMGSKNQTVRVGFCPWVCLLADDTSSDASTVRRNSSVAYSNFHFNFVKRLEIKGIGNGWVNENQFYLNRTNFITFSGPYAHNHNKFYNGTMEGPGAIRIENGSHHNYFYGLRFERDPSNSAHTLQLYFDNVAYSNTVETSWEYSGFHNAPYNYTDAQLSPLVSVYDPSGRNIVTSRQESETDSVVLFSLNSLDHHISNYNKSQISAFRDNSDLAYCTNVKHNIDGTFTILDTYRAIFNEEEEILEFNPGDLYSFVSDAKVFRIVIRFYDINKKKITTEFSNILPSVFYYAADGSYTSSISVQYSNIKFAPVSNIETIKYISIVIAASGSAANETFSYMSLVGRYPRHLTAYARTHLTNFVSKRWRSVATYYNDADIDMNEVAESVLCFKSDMSEMRYNRFRVSFVAKEVSGPYVTMDRATRAVANFPPMTLLYVNSQGVETALPVSSFSTVAPQITLAADAPSDLVAGTDCVLISTASKSLTVDAALDSASENPVQNRAVHAALAAIEARLNALEGN